MGELKVSSKHIFHSLKLTEDAIQAGKPSQLATQDNYQGDITKRIPWNLNQRQIARSWGFLLSFGYNSPRALSFLFAFHI